MKFCVSVY